MRLFTLIAFVCLLSFATGCTTSENDIVAPPVSGFGQLNDFSNTPGVLECRANMRTIASQCIIFFAENSRYPESLEEIGMEDFFCPDCGLQYSYFAYFNEGTQEPEFFIECPLPSDPNHGCIDNGVPSWTTPQEPSEDACRANMRTIASQAVLYFANHSRYPKILEEICIACVVCPVCHT